jgi:hypothetical protein
VVGGGPGGPAIGELPCGLVDTVEAGAVEAGALAAGWEVPLVLQAASRTAQIAAISA